MSPSEEPELYMDLVNDSKNNFAYSFDLLSFRLKIQLIKASAAQNQSVFSVPKLFSSNAIILLKKFVFSSVSILKASVLALC